MTTTKPTLRCPCCDQPMDTKNVQTMKRSINEFLSTLTNPPRTIQGFYDAARESLDDIGVGVILAAAVSDIPNDRWHFSSTDPWTVNRSVREWDCTLTLQGCYGKVEVCYFS